jgi:GNAT superfamily N-acetyltransferase
MPGDPMDNRFFVRQFDEADAAQVQDLFVRVNRLLAPPELKDAFETYIASSRRQEIDKISEYYEERNGSFWVATVDATIVGMFGLEQSGPEAMELRRMYVNPDRRRQGIARKMLQFAEDHCRAENVHRLDLSTSEIQSDALSFYQGAGFDLVREETADVASNKTIGGGINRYYFKKDLRA